MKFIEIWDDIILWEIVGRLEIEEEDGNYTMSLYDKDNEFITDIWYSDDFVWESYRDDFIKYLMEKDSQR